VIALDVASEAGFIGWIATYVDDARHWPDWLSAASPMAFWTGVTLVRFLVARRRLEAWVLVPMTATAAACVLLMLLVPGAPGAMLLIFLVGCAVGPVFPIVVETSARAFPNDIDTGTAFMLGTTGTLEMVVPLLLGTAAALADTTAAGLVVVAITFCLASTAAAFATATVARPAYT
jgi:fucose permease